MGLLIRSSQIGAIVLHLTVMGGIIHGQENADSADTPVGQRYGPDGIYAGRIAQ